MGKGTCVKIFCFIYYNCIIILLSVTVFVCHDKGSVFLYNKFTSICILETSNNGCNNINNTYLFNTMTKCDHQRYLP